jgi:hypothetical protein
MLLPPPRVLLASVAFLLVFRAQAMRAGEASPEPRIRILNLEDGETIRYPVALLRGTLEGGDAPSLVVINTSSDRPYRELPGLVHEGKFKALAELVPGPNRLVLRAGSSELAITIIYRLQTSPYVVRVFYLTDKTGDTSYQSQLDKDPQDYAAKLDTAFKLLQAFTAEALHDQGMGRRTFRLELDEAGRVKVHVFRGERAAEDYYSMDDGAWWDLVSGEIQRRFPDPRAKNVALAAYTRFDTEKKRVFGHTALGGGALALFGSAGLFSWPSSLSDVFRAFGDTRPVDPDRIHDDSAGRGTFWGLASTTMGATLHEMGHTFDLPHSSDPYDIMSRGFDHLNRFFAFVRPPTRDGGEPTVFPPDHAARFAPHNATALRAHRWFALDARDFRDDGAPRISFSESPEGLRIEAPNGLRFLGIDAGGDATDHRAFWSGEPPREYFLPRGEILGGWPSQAHFRATDDQGLMAFASWAEFVSPREFVRAWRFSTVVQEWAVHDAFPPVDEEKLKAVETSASAAALQTSKEGFVDFAARFPDRGSNVAAYAFRQIQSDRPRKVKILAGSDDALRIWLNGKLILHTLALRPAQPDEDVAIADFEPGENRVLVEVSQADGGWGLFFRLEDEEGKKLEITESGALQTIDGR